MPVTKEELLGRLAGMGVAVTTYEHEAVFTVEEGEEMRARIPFAPGSAHSKNLFLKDKKGNCFLVTAKQETEIDLKQLHRLIGGRGRLSFGNAEKLMEYLGVPPGSVTPFAVINDTAGNVTMILDRALMDHDIGNYHPLTNTATTAIGRDDLVRVLEAFGHAPQIIDVSRNNPELQAQA